MDGPHVLRRRPRMIATDLDGTIIGYDHTRSGFITPRTVEAFQNAPTSPH